MRFGLVGTGPWARGTHGPGLVASPDAVLVGVWGRDPGRTGELAETLGVTRYDDYETLLEDVEAVAFAVPPHVQAPLALEAAEAGRHLLLDKPVAGDAASARALAAAAATTGVASVVFFTDRFSPVHRDWWETVRRTGGWHGAWMRWFGALDAPRNPYGASPWRHERGALWDLGPHALSSLEAALGPVASLTAVAGEKDLVTLAVRHESGATSVVTMTQFAPPAATHVELTLWGEAGLETMPPRPGGVAALFGVAVGELVAAVRTGRPSEVDLRFGVRVVELLDDAQQQLDQARLATGERTG